jgi:hypothetical protein
MRELFHLCGIAGRACTLAGIAGGYDDLACGRV